MKVFLVPPVDKVSSPPLKITFPELILGGLQKEKCFVVVVVVFLFFWVFFALCFCFVLFCFFTPQVFVLFCFDLF